MILNCAFLDCVAPCGSGWPSTLYITTAGQTFAIVNGYLTPGVWSGWVLLPISSKTISCTANLTYVYVNVWCNGSGDLVVTLTWGVINCSGTCYYGGSSTNCTSSCVVSSWTNSPFSFSGTWDTSSCNCFGGGSMPNPLAGTSVSGSP
jgi:hypothetical protein